MSAVTDFRILQGDAIEMLQTLESCSVQCCITSPPYWGLRSYLPDNHPQKHLELGLEKTPDEYVARTVEIFREVHRVLADDGVLWLNLGDSYVSKHGSPHPGEIESDGYARKNRLSRLRAPKPPGLKYKDLVGIPWRVALALQREGWYLRADVIWQKPNAMPERVFDRPTSVHEYVFLLSKRASYFYDIDAIREPHSMRPQRRPNGHKQSHAPGQPSQTHSKSRRDEPGVDGHPMGRNKRSVWSISTEPFSEAHFAVMPTRLAEPCVLASSRPGDLVLDPFVGAGTVALVALRHGRRFVGCEINDGYVQLATRRIRSKGWWMAGDEVSPSSTDPQIPLWQSVKASD